MLQQFNNPDNPKVRGWRGSWSITRSLARVTSCNIFVVVVVVVVVVFVIVSAYIMDQLRDGGDATELSEHEKRSPPPALAKNSVHPVCVCVCVCRSPPVSRTYALY
ncbi:unnamed protein product [Scytosiphon promiscuus]